MGSEREVSPASLSEVGVATYPVSSTSFSRFSFSSSGGESVRAIFLSSSAASPLSARSSSSFFHELLAMAAVSYTHLDVSKRQFELNVLSLKQTLCEKTVSLIRFSMSQDPLASLSSKIRHFYDLNALMTIKDLEEYVCGVEFVRDVETLVKHDQAAFDEPFGWKGLKDLTQSPLVLDFEKLWEALTPRSVSYTHLDVYKRQIVASN